MLDEMRDNIITKYGFESPTTLNFCKVCEDIEETTLYAAWLYTILMSL